MKEMLSAAREFERVCSRQAYVAHQYIDVVLWRVDLSLLERFGITVDHIDAKENIRWIGPIVF
jgi:hypothetical protein